MDNQAEKTKGKWYFRWWAWCLWVFLVVSIVSGASSNSDRIAPVDSSSSKIEEPIEAMKVTSSQLSADYKANEVAADAKYKGKLVEIIGTVEDIGKDVLDNAYVTFALGQYEIINKVQCFFEKADESQLLELQQGERVTLRGTVKGGSFNVIVDECRLVE